MSLATTSSILISRAAVSCFYKAFRVLDGSRRFSNKIEASRRFKHVLSGSNVSGLLGANFVLLILALKINQTKGEKYNLMIYSSKKMNKKIYFNGLSNVYP